MKKLLLTIFSLAFFAIAASAQETGTCGDNLTYELSTDGVLTISGSGEMSSRAFYQRADIKSVVIEEGVTSIGVEAFYFCTSLTSISIPSSVTSIGDGAFVFCSALERIISEATKPAECTSSAFTLVKSSIPVHVPQASIETYKNTEGWKIFSNFQPISSPVQETGKCGDSLTYELSTEGVLTIKGTGEMSTRAFYKRADIKSVVIEEGATSIGVEAFFQCTSLTSVSIPSSVTSIESGAFYYCTALGRIISYATEPAECPSTAFGQVTPSIPVYVPEASISTYASAEGWNHFNNFQSIETSVDETAAEALVVTAKDGYVSVNAKEFAIMDLAGVDVTAENGSLSGVYLVKVGAEVVKVMVR